MGSFERKMERNRLKEAHKRLKKQWRTENKRREAGVEVPVQQDTISPTNSVETDSTKVPLVPYVQTKRLPLLGRPPTLGQYAGMVKKMNAQIQEAQAKAKAAEAQAKVDAEKKIDLEWKDE